MKRSWMVLGIAGCLLGGCRDKEVASDDTDDTEPTGEAVEEVWEYIGINGYPGWLYSRADTTQMIVSASGKTTNNDNVRNTLLYSVDDYDVKTQLKIQYSHTITWSSGPDTGIRIHGHDGMEYTNPITVAPAAAYIGDTRTTTNTLAAYESTLVGFESCPNSVSDDWTCLHIQITGGNGEYFIGDWWLEKEWGTAIFHPEVEDLQWVLRSAS